MPTRPKPVTPTDVSAALNLHPGVHRSTVVTHHDPRGTVWLAYVSMDPADRTSHKALKAYLQSRLPGVELPIMFIRLDSLPRMYSPVSSAA
jgi:acyl-coenzyme A synthetase/AMP-(fatty) acid ligase